MASGRVAIAVIGSANPSEKTRALAFEVGRELAKRGAMLICGGLGGVMEAAAKGAYEHGALTVGILPGYERSAANPYIVIPIATGMGEARNVIVVASAQAVIAMEGESGTMTEIGFALKLRRPVVALDAWHHIDGLERADSPVRAVELAIQLASKG